MAVTELLPMLLTHTWHSHTSLRFSRDAPCLSPAWPRTTRTPRTAGTSVHVVRCDALSYAAAGIWPMAQSGRECVNNEQTKQFLLMLALSLDTCARDEDCSKGERRTRGGDPIVCTDIRCTPSESVCAPRGCCEERLPPRGLYDQR